VWAFSAPGKRVSPTLAEPALSGVFFSVTGHAGTSSFLNIYGAQTHHVRRSKASSFGKMIFPKKSLTDSLENHLITPRNPEITDQLPLKFPYKN